MSVLIISIVVLSVVATGLFFSGAEFSPLSVGYVKRMKRMGKKMSVGVLLGLILCDHIVVAALIGGLYFGIKAGIS